MILNQPAADLAQVGSFDQLFEENFSRYVGLPIRVMLETSPGITGNIEKVTY